LPLFKKILNYLGIDEFKRDSPPSRALAATDSFDDYVRDDKLNCPVVISNIFRVFSFLSDRFDIILNS